MSYRSTQGEFCLKLVADLRAAGFPVWMDQQGGIVPSDDWVMALQNGVDGAGAMLIALSPEYGASNYCRIELQRATGHGYPLIPVLIADVTLTERPFELTRIQHLDFRAWRTESTYQSKLAELKAVIQDKTKIVPGAPLPPPPPPKPLAPLRYRTLGLKLSEDGEALTLQAMIEGETARSLRLDRATLEGTTDGEALYRACFAGDMGTYVQEFRAACQRDQAIMRVLIDAPESLTRLDWEKMDMGHPALIARQEGDPLPISGALEGTVRVLLTHHGAEVESVEAELCELAERYSARIEVVIDPAITLLRVYNRLKQAARAGDGFQVWHHLSSGQDGLPTFSDGKGGTIPAKVGDLQALLKVATGLRAAFWQTDSALDPILIAPLSVPCQVTLAGTPDPGLAVRQFYSTLLLRPIEEAYRRMNAVAGDGRARLFLNADAARILA